MFAVDEDARLGNSKRVACILVELTKDGPGHVFLEEDSLRVLIQPEGVDTYWF